jgi:hypothetical protein
MFKISSNKGFHVTFKNGVTISTQFGAGNYCSNYDSEMDSKLKKCPNSEIAIWNKSGEYITKEIMKMLSKDEDDVVGHITPDEWLDIIVACKNYKE